MLWQSTSGLGSELDATAVLRAELPRLFQRLGVTSLLDAPCGDAGWINQADLGVRYVGIDIVPELIERLQGRAAVRRNQRRILISPISRRTRCRVAMPSCAAIAWCICRLPISNARSTNFRASGASVADRDHAFRSGMSNADCEDGDWRALNFERAPFNWGPPVELLQRELPGGRRRLARQEPWRVAAGLTNESATFADLANDEAMTVE